MWGVKSPKSEVLDNPNIRIVSKHKEKHVIKSLEKGGIFGSIDPAQKNYTLRFEKRPSSTHRKKVIKATEFCRVDLLSKSNDEDKFITLALNDFLSSYDFSEVKCVFVERQMAENYKSTWIAHHTYAFLSIKYPNVIIVEISATLKTKMLGAPPGLNKTYIKKWAVEKSLKLLKKRKDESSIDYINVDRKKDDKADTIVQLEAICVYYANLGHDVVTTNDI